MSTYLIFFIYLYQSFVVHFIEEMVHADHLIARITCYQPSTVEWHDMNTDMTSDSERRTCTMVIVLARLSSANVNSHRKQTVFNQCSRYLKRTKNKITLYTLHIFITCFTICDQFTDMHTQHTRKENTQMWNKYNPGLMFCVSVNLMIVM